MRGLARGPSRTAIGICSRANATSASASWSLTRPVARHGSTQAAKQHSAFQTFPIPAMTRWSSRTSPIGRAGSCARRRAMNRSGSNLSPRTSCPSAASRGSRAGATVRHQLEHRTVELHDLPSAPAHEEPRTAGERLQRSPSRWMLQAPVILRCECSVIPPSKRRNRCLPWASTARIERPARSSGQRSAGVPRMRRGELIGDMSRERRADPLRRVMDRVALGHRPTIAQVHRTRRTRPQTARLASPCQTSPSLTARSAHPACGR